MERDLLRHAPVDEQAQIEFLAGRVDVLSERVTELEEQLRQANDALAAADPEQQPDVREALRLRDVEIDALKERLDESTRELEAARAVAGSYERLQQSRSWQLMLAWWGVRNRLRALRRT